MNVVALRPILKYAGGKTQLLDRYLPLIPETFRMYHEPFVGGGAVFFFLASTGRLQARAYINDMNVDLMNVYRQVRDRSETVIDALDALPVPSEFDYYKARSNFNERPRRLTAARAALFIYLNKTCFNGLFRVNRAGEFNVPYGKLKSPSITGSGHLREAAEALQGVNICCGDFADVLATAQEDDFVYLDPPYVPASDTANFTNYTADGFDWGQQERLAEIFRGLAERGVKVMLSNFSSPTLVQLYTGLDIEGLNITHVRARRSINSDGDKRGPVLEVVIRNYRD